jgi:tocopherol cyclase
LEVNLYTRLKRWLQTTLNPACYHGGVKKPPFFEGWYYKLVDRTERRRYAIIPGVFLGDGGGETHAFVQVLDGQSGSAIYHEYPIEEFWSAEGVFDIRVGANQFTSDHVILDTRTADLTLMGRLDFQSPTPWPVTLRSPGIMGWYAWVPFMECYHGVVSLDHTLHGALQINGRHIDFTGGRGYIEKDWGKSFPEAWIWFQTNHFESAGTSLTASIARIPWIGSAFPGFIIGFWHAGTLYRFATYTGAETEHLDITDERITWIVRDKHHLLEMKATRREGGLLRAPTLEGMGRRIGETLNATVEVRLFGLRAPGAGLLFGGTGRHAGLEAAGDLGRLRDADGGA